MAALLSHSGESSKTRSLAINTFRPSRRKAISRCPVTLKRMSLDEAAGDVPGSRPPICAYSGRFG